MSTDRRSFDEVEGLLGRLDHSLDEARRKRLGEPEGPPAAGPPRDRSPDLDAVIGRSEEPQAGERDRASPPPAPAPLPRSENGERTGSDAEDPLRPPRSKYGRAKPLRKPGPPTGYWME